ncbi:MAG TPA: MFS transporter [Burkholderiales bacterium]|nr:MFS transporter [Burkholderiales bacterium]
MARLHYGWVVLAALCCVGFARQGPAVATLSIFIDPLSREFGWSRTALSGAVSLGGVLAALVSPAIGPLLDRHGPRLILCIAVLVNAAALALLSLTPSLLVFYVLFCIARTNWAVPFDLGIYGAVNSWFVARRAFATSVATMAQIAGLVAMPLVAQLAIDQGSWRTGWIALAAVTLGVGFLPAWLFLGRKPGDNEVVAPPGHVEPRFSRAQAVRTPAFWLLMLYTVLVFPVQAGVSLHQASHLVERGIDPTTAATVVSTFSLMAGLGTFACGLLPRRLPVRFAMAFAGLLSLAGVLLMIRIASPADGYLAAGVFGFGIGAVLTLLPVAWADYFGRENFGAIRGLALSAQVLSQAVGPILSGVLHDLTGNYLASLYCFAALSALTVVAALAARRPTESAGRS